MRCPAAAGDQTQLASPREFTAPSRVLLRAERERDHPSGEEDGSPDIAAALFRGADLEHATGRVINDKIGINRVGSAAELRLLVNHGAGGECEEKGEHRRSKTSERCETL